MVKLIIAILLSAVMASSTVGAEETARARAWASMTDAQRIEADIEYKAAAAGMSPETFDLFSRVIEAESDRSDNFEGRVLVALTILNRVDASQFPNSIEGVIYQSGQFEVVSNGMIYSVGRTTLSDAAILEAQKRFADGTAPRVMYFNATGYNYGEPYIYEGGNYFVTVDF